MAFQHSQRRDIVPIYEEYAYLVGATDWQEALATFISELLAAYDRYGKHHLPVMKYLEAQLGCGANEGANAERSQSCV